MELDFDKLPRFKNHAMEILSLLPQWASAYEVSREAIVNQIYISHAWADSNPKKAPKKQIPRFLFNWMEHAKRYGNLKTPQRPTIKPAEPEPNYDMTPEEMIAIRERNMRRGHA